jgi:hypothetical protein
MLIHELTPEQCTDVLTRVTLGRLGCTRRGQPYVVPIHYSFDVEKNCLYCFSTVGQKVAWMRENPKVCVEIEEFTGRDRWTTVLIFGRYEEIGDSPVDAVTRERVWTLFQQRSEWWLPAAARLPSKQPHAMVIYRIVIDRLTGRRASGSEE